MDVPWMRGVADFVKGINQCTLLVGLKCNVEFDDRPSGCVAQALPVGRDGIPSVLDLQVHLIPMHRGHRESSEYAE